MARVNRKTQYIISASVMSAAMVVFGILLKYLTEGIYYLTKIYETSLTW